MDELYSTILRTCDWDDDDFADGYYLGHGSCSGSPDTFIAVNLGLIDQIQPIQTLHLSLRTSELPHDHARPQVDISNLSLRARYPTVFLIWIIEKKRLTLSKKQSRYTVSPAYGRSSCYIQFRSGEDP